MNVFDCETYEDDKNVFIYCISYSYKNKVYSIYNQNGDIFTFFLNELVDRVSENKITFYIHNINFDGMLIMNSIFNNNLSFKWLVRDTNIYYIELKYVHINLIFKCSYKFLPISLKSIFVGELQKKIFPYKFVNKDNLNYVGSCPSIDYFNSDVDLIVYNEFKKKNLIFNLKEVTLEYCENDVKITINFLNKLLEVMGLKYSKIFNKSFSAPSLSYKIFFKYWNSLNIKENLLKEEEIYVRKSYYGGRCEVFGNPLNSDIVHYFDFSGMYEQCMRTKFPIGEGFFSTENLNVENIGFHVIKYKSDMSHPILPQHSNKNKLIFPNGIMQGCYWYEEISLFSQNGGEILEVISSYLYKEEDYVFKDFINEFSEIKKKGGFYKIFGKLMINSLYGSFAMSDKNYESLVCFSESEFKKILEKTDVLETIKKNNCYIMKIVKNSKSIKILKDKDEYFRFSTRNISYASIIASKARIKLYKGFCDVINSGGRILYCDTDSIAASYNENKLNNQYGEVKWQEIWKDAVFIGPKFYAFKDENNKDIIKIKGISKNDYNFSQLKNLFYANKESIFYNSQLNFRKKKYELKQTYVKKIISLNKYDKRIFTENKKNTRPLLNPPYNE